MRRLPGLSVLAFSIATPVLLAQTPAPTPAAGQQVPKGVMPTLGRPTEGTDAVPLLDFDNYFVGKWTFEWTLPDSPLGPAGDVSGTTIVTKLGGAFYEATTEGKGPSGPFTTKEIWAYHAESKMVVRQVTDSRGFSFLQFGPVGGDLGGIYNLHFESAPFTANGKSVRFKSSLRLLSPLNYRVAMSLSVDGGPFTNLGNPWWRKDLSYVSKK
jgi:Protein of unknown function (DUF1579)